MGSTFVATFGQGQFGGTLKDSYILFENATNIQVRRWMVRHFDSKWSGTYEGSEGASYVSQYSARYTVKTKADA